MNYRLKDLTDLVKSLSVKERRQFVSFVSKSDASVRQPFYLQLFHGIESGILEFFDPGKMSSKEALTTAKKILFEKLSDFLVFYHRNGSEEMLIGNYLNKVEILYQKFHLPEQANLLLQKALTYCRNNERFDLLLSALHWERKMSMVLQRGIRPLTDIFIEEQNIYSKLHVIGQLESLYWKAKQYKRDGGYAAGLSHNDLTELSVSANAVIRHDNHTSKKALYYFNFIHALYYWMIKDYKNGYLSSKALLNAEIQAVMPSDYMDGLLEFVNASFCMGYFEQCLTGLKVARVYFEVQSLGLTQSYAMKLFAYESVYLLMVYNFMGNTEALDKTIENVVDKFGSNSRFLPLDVQQVILGNMMNAYVGAGNLNKAISIWSGLFKKKTRVREDVYASLYLFRLFAYVSCGYYELIPGIAETGYKYYNRRRKNDNKQFEVEIKICLLFKKDYDLSSTLIRNGVLLEIKELLSLHIQSMAPETSFQEYFSFYLIWTNSLSGEEAFSEAALKSYANSRNIQVQT